MWEVGKSNIEAFPTFIKQIPQKCVLYHVCKGVFSLRLKELGKITFLSLSFFRKLWSVIF